ncbi:MAG: Gfo/Idh/MocA family oxidoreductase [Nitrosopumilaceae archaeon]
MKFLIVGLGSMGKRRIRNLKALDQNYLIGFDTRIDRCSEANEKYQIKTFTDISEALKEKPNAMVISTPPDLHMKYAKVAIQNKIHFFTEASVIQDEMEEVINSLKDSNIIGLPSSTMRYHPIVISVQHIIKSNKIGKPIAFLYHSGQYLPDWHPWEDYRKFYVSKRVTGACREIVPFEIIWLTNIFGKIQTVSALKSKVSRLEADIDDIYNVLFEFEGGLQGNLTVDVIARFPFRQLKVLGEEGVILADWSDRTVRYFTKEEGWVEKKIDDGVIEKNYIHGDGPYIDEMRAFIKSINKEILQPYTFEEDLKILKLLEAIERSGETGYKQSTTNLMNDV